MLRASREGARLAYLNLWQVAQDLAEGRLDEVLGEWLSPYAGLCLYCPGRRHIPAKLRALVDLIRELDRDQFAGMP